MKRTMRFFLFILFVVCTACASFSQGNDARKVFRKVAPTVLTLYTHDNLHHVKNQGSGVVIHPQYAVTNLHLLNTGGNHVIIKQNEKEIKDVEIVYADYEKDFMLLKFSKGMFPAIKMGNSEKTEVGERAFAVGSPMGMENTISEGIVSGKRESSNVKLTLIQISCPISPGSSGGAVVNKRGELIGISTLATLTEGQNINFAVPVNYFSSLISMDFNNDSAREVTFLKIGNYQYANGNYNEAIYWYDRILPIDPENVPALFNIGTMYYKKGDSTLGLKYFVKALELDMKRQTHYLDSAYYISGYNAADLYKYLADYYYLQNDTANAIKYYSKNILLSKQPGSDIYKCLAEAYAVSGQYQQGIYFARKAIETDSLNSDAYQAVITCYLQWCFPDAEMKSIKTTMKKNPEKFSDQNMNDIFNHVLSKENRILLLDSIIYFGNKLIGLKPTSEMAYRALGLVYMQKGNYLNAIHYYQYAAMYNPDNKNNFFFLSYIYEQLGDLKKAEYFEQIAKDKATIPTQTIVLENIDHKKKDTVYSRQKKNYLQECAMKLGGNYYIHVKNLLISQNETILLVDDWNKQMVTISFKIFDTKKTKVAEISNGKIIKGENLIQIISSENKYLVVDKSSQGLLLHLEKETSEGKCEIHSWGNFYLPDGNQFQFTPEQTNSTFLENIKGAIFKDSDTGIVFD